jgi:hypothetical protein
MIGLYILPWQDMKWCQNNGSLLIGVWESGYVSSGFAVVDWSKESPSMWSCWDSVSRSKTSLDHGPGGLALWTLEQVFRSNVVIHRAHKAIQGDDCRSRRRSWLKFPWLSPIWNSFKLRGLYRRSYFGPRTCGGGITNVIEVIGALNQGFPFSPLLPHFRGLQDGVEYKFLD